MKFLTPRLLYYAQVVVWGALMTALYCYASHLETENRVREYPTEEIADELQLREMERYHADQGEQNILFFD